MITGMKRTFLVIPDRGRAESLRNLRKLGLLHVEPVPGAGEDYEKLSSRQSNIERAIGILSSMNAKGARRGMKLPDSLEVVERSIALSEEICTLGERRIGMERELERVMPWGEFDPRLFGELDAAGVRLSLVESTPEGIDSLASGADLLRFSADKYISRAILIGDGPLPEAVRAFDLPDEPISSMIAELTSMEKAILERERDLKALVPALPSLAGFHGVNGQRLEFERIRSGMSVDGPVCWIEGWIPERDTPALERVASANGWGVAFADPSADEAPPSKVENNAAIRIINPVFDFLGMVPGYREYDISLWFLLFFSVFYAMIFGDGGYGALMICAGLFALAKGGRKASDAVKLLLVVGSATTAWGAMTGTWFGLDASTSDGFLSRLVVPAFAGTNPLSQENVKLFCFLLGTVQLSLAHLKNIRRDFPNPKFLAQVGWLGVVTGLYYFVLNLVIDTKKFPIPGYSLWLIAGGFLLVFAFANWDGSLGKSLLAGLGGLLSQFLGTVGAFGDIISYIRLFAVGLAGLSIAQTVNQMAGGMMKGWTIPFGILIVVFGHALNLAMSFLSVIVHGIRLNLLEFSGHLGMEWSGYAYEPFREKFPEGEVSGKENQQTW
ncbi:MAG: V-type ATP synthase subunit I [Spirochaetes bacterium]|nr:V-type ATP synthase subunit I [Spirochaetota bacterium]